MTVVTGGKVDADERIVKEHEVYRSPLLPGFELPLDRLLKVADDWSVRRPSGPERGQAKDRPPG